MYNGKMRTRTASLLTLGVIAVFVVVWVSLLALVGPSKLVSIIGVQNGYLLAFLIAAFGGFSSLTAVSLVATIVTLSAGGLNPLLLGLFAGTGMTIGDLIYFYLGNAGRNALHPESRLRALVEKSSAWLSDKPKWMLPLVTFIYAGFLPLPNDVLTVSLALAGGKMRVIVVPLFLGNIIHASRYAYLGIAAWWL